MSQPQVVYAQVVFQGGLYDTDARPTAIRVMQLAGLTALIYVVSTLISVTNEDYRDLAIEIQSNSSEFEIDEDLVTTIFILSSIAGLLCILTIPVSTV